MKGRREYSREKCWNSLVVIHWEQSWVEIADSKKINNTFPTIKGSIVHRTSNNQRLGRAGEEEALSSWVNKYVTEL